MRILYVTALSETINAFLIPHIKMLVDCGNSVDIACNNTQELNSELVELGCRIYIIPFSRDPFRVRNILAYRRLRELINQSSYDIVHTHTPVASSIARLAFKKTGCRIIYTAHGFHFCKGESFLSWALYYPVEKWLSKYTDLLITINKEDFEFAKSSLNSKDLVYLPGVGVDLNMFRVDENEKSIERSDIGIPEGAKLILSVGELSERKNHAVVIEALNKIKNNNIHYVICGEGDTRKHLVKMAANLDLAEQVHLLGFRSDINKLLPLADLFIFPSKREGLPVALMEALLAGVPIIASDIRGNIDLSNLDLPMSLLKQMTSQNLAVEIVKWMNGNLFDRIFSNPKEVLKPFSIEEVKEHLRIIYSGYNLLEIQK